MILYPYTVLLLISSLINFVLAFWSFRKKGVSGSKYFSLMMLSVFIWSLSEFFNYSLLNVNSKIIASQISYLGVVSIAPFYFLFVSKYGDFKRVNNSKLLRIIWVIPVFILALVFTNKLHGLIWPEIIGNQTNYGLVLEYKHGTGVLILALYSYPLLVMAFYMLLKIIFVSKRIFKFQATVLIIGALVPWISNFLYLSGLNPLKYFDLTPFAFTISGILLGYGVFRFHLLDIIPIAKEKLFDRMLDVVIVLDKYSRIIDYNPSITIITDEKKLVGKEIIEVIPELSKVSDEILNNRDDKKEMLIKTFDTEKWFDIQIIKLKDNKNNHTGMLFIFRDVTERKDKENRILQSENELKILNATKDKFFGIVAHDLKGPISGVLGLINIINQEIYSMPKDELASLLMVLKSAIENVYKLLNNLLFWSKSQKGELKFNPEPNKIQYFVDMALSVLIDSAKTKEIKIGFEQFVRKIVYVDSEMILSVFRNIISNSIKFSEKHGEIFITVNDYDVDKVLVEIKDKGIGMDEDSLKKIFKIDEKFSQEGTEGEKGTGLGLVLCSEFIKKHNCELWINSEIGKGTCVAFTLPKYKGQLTQPSDS